MDALNTLRAVLVGGTFVLTLLLAFDGRWVPAAVLAVGILAHIGLWMYLWRQKQDAGRRAAALGGAPPVH